MSVQFDQVRDQDAFFDGLGFEKIDMHYEFGDLPCFRSPCGHYYRIDHFGCVFAIEYADNEKEAMLGQFEDGDLFDDDLPHEELIRQIHESIRKDT